MPRFITRLVYSGVEGHNRLWITELPFIAESDIVGRIEIPAGFIFDGNSLPRVMWWLSLPTDFMETGCIHDFLYRYCADRKLADEVYREFLALQENAQRVAAISEGERPEPKWYVAVRTSARYSALRLFGGSAYREDHSEAGRAS